MTKRFITDKEWELIEAVRNYKSAYSNGAKAILFYIRMLFDELLDRD